MRLPRLNRRSLCELVGISRYSRMGLHELDRKLERHIGYDHGIFIEAGANNGVEQSNTYYLERIRHWDGLLVEPVPELAECCRNNRRARVAQAALVATEETGGMVELHWAGLMSTLTGALGDAETTARHVDAGLAVQGLPQSHTLRVPARTLSSLLDEAGFSGKIDLLSLDVEGAEAIALRGLDFTRHRPQFICVEVRDPVAIEAVIGSYYRQLEVLTDLGTHRDVLYVAR